MECETAATRARGIVIHGPAPRPRDARLAPRCATHRLPTRSPERTLSRSKPSVLVVLPTLGDRLEFLAQTLASVQAQRSTVDLTLVVVSPPRATQARELASSYGAVLVDDPKQGISAAINCGLRARTDERYYAWIGDDDLFLDGGLELLRDLLESDERAVVAYGGCDYIDSAGRTVWTSAVGKLARFLLPWGPDLIPNPSAMIRFDALEAIGGFDESLRFAMDLDAFLSLRKHGRFVATRVPVSAFRWHPESLTVSDRSGSSSESEAVKRRHLPRWVRPLSPLWDVPVRFASRRAANNVTATAKALAHKNPPEA
ncbi:glycosyltransferase [Microbacterium yannicii]|uniref:glycosyltransferase n=1 Tax=Microbacterium yannicii TaxID=671622 RepID=UPI002092210F|nr:glycosyltransferase [Microbacterium yannicii]MCO5953382.1 glycosyltransferase [Microbacterium yannicii]